VLFDHGTTCCITNDAVARVAYLRLRRLFGFTFKQSTLVAHLVRTTWQTPWHVSASLTWRYIGAVSQDNDSSDPTLHFVPFMIRLPQRQNPAFNYVDLRGHVECQRDRADRAGANIARQGSAPRQHGYRRRPVLQNTYSTYDLFGRRLFWHSREILRRHMTANENSLRKPAPHTLLDCRQGAVVRSELPQIVLGSAICMCSRRLRRRGHRCAESCLRS